MLPKLLVVAFPRLQGFWENVWLFTPYLLFFFPFLVVEISSRMLIPLFAPGSVHRGSASWLWQSICWWAACELVFWYVPWLCLDSGIVSPLCWDKGVCLFRCNLPPALLTEWQGNATVVTWGWNRHWIRVNLFCIKNRRPAATWQNPPMWVWARCCRVPGWRRQKEMAGRRAESSWAWCCCHGDKLGRLRARSSKWCWCFYHNAGNTSSLARRGGNWMKTALCFTPSGLLSKWLVHTKIFPLIQWRKNYRTEQSGSNI